MQIDTFTIPWKSGKWMSIVFSAPHNPMIFSGKLAPISIFNLDSFYLSSEEFASRIYIEDKTSSFAGTHSANTCVINFVDRRQE